MSKVYSNIKYKFSLIVEQLLASTSSTNMVREIKNVSPNCK